MLAGHVLERAVWDNGVGQGITQGEMGPGMLMCREGEG